MSITSSSVPYEQPKAPEASEYPCIKKYIGSESSRQDFANGTKELIVLFIAPTRGTALVSKGIGHTIGALDDGWVASSSSNWVPFRGTIAFNLE